MEVTVKTWKKLSLGKCNECQNKLCNNCRYVKVFEDGKLFLENGKMCNEWSYDPSQEDWNNLLDDIQITRILQMYE